jgi:hypothetical protein
MGWLQSPTLAVGVGMLLAALACAGCSRRVPAGVPLCDRLFPHDDRYHEFGFYGHHPTCWQSWPVEWMGCPQQVAHDPAVFPYQPVEMLPSAPVPPTLSSPPEMPPTGERPAPGFVPVPTLPAPAPETPNGGNGALRMPERGSSVQLIKPAGDGVPGLAARPLAEVLRAEGVPMQPLPRVNEGSQP